jgi:hypothetical protein
VGQIPNQWGQPPINLRVLALVHRLRRVHGQRNLVREEVAGEVHGDRDYQAHHKAVPAAKVFARHQQNAAQHPQQQGRFETIHAASS